MGPRSTISRAVPGRSASTVYGGHEHVLHHVLGLLPVVEHANRQPVERGLVAVHQGLERAGVPVACPGREDAVRDGGVEDAVVGRAGSPGRRGHASTIQVLGDFLVRFCGQGEIPWLRIYNSYPAWQGQSK